MSSSRRARVSSKLDLLSCAGELESDDIRPTHSAIPARLLHDAAGQPARYA